MNLSLDDALGRLQKVKKAGSGYLASCPVHDDDLPSLSLTKNDEGALLVRCHAGCDFTDIVRALGSADSDDKPGKPLEKFVEASHFYYTAEGELYGRKEKLRDSDGRKSYRWSHPDGKQWRTGKPAGDIPLYRLPELVSADPAMTVVVVEGEKDADVMAKLGYVVTSPPSGAGAKWRQADTKHFVGRKVCVIADDDEPGRKYAAAVIEALRGTASEVESITMPNPDGIKGFDVSDFLERGGSPEELSDLIANFADKPLPVEIVNREALHSSVLTLWEGGDTPGVYPGWDVLEPYYRPRIGEVTTVTGAPNAGKSSWVDDLMVRVSCGNVSSNRLPAGWKWVVFSAEQFPPQRHVKSLLKKLLNKPFDPGVTTRMTKQEVQFGMNLINRYWTFFNPSAENCSLDRILDVAKEVNRREQHQGLVIDPYNIVSAASRTRDLNEHEFINEALAKIRKFSQSQQMHVIIVAHPTKLTKEPNESEYPVARPWNISGSGHWFNYSDAILSVWRPMQDKARRDIGEVEIHIQKIRFQPESGELGMVRLYFDKLTSRFNEKPRRSFEFS